ncbi:MAG: aldehyde dehydrogenase family protein [Ignavibacteria bacterium]
MLKHKNNFQDIKTANIKSEYSLYINGKFHKTNRAYQKNSPIKGNLLATIPIAASEEVQQAFDKAKSALRKWSKLEIDSKLKLVAEFLNVFSQKATEFAITQTLETGYIFRDSLNYSFKSSVQSLKNYISGEQFTYNKIESSVIIIILPHQQPLKTAVEILTTELLKGNTIVALAPELSPITVYKLAEVFDSVGFPNGVINIISGDLSTRRFLLGFSDKVRYIIFENTGKDKEYLFSTSPFEKLNLYKRGKSINVIFEDASLNDACYISFLIAYVLRRELTENSNFFFIQESIKDFAIAKIKHNFKQIKTGNPLDFNVDISALLNIENIENIKNILSQARKNNCEVIFSGLKQYRKENFISPILIDNVTLNDQIFEIPHFGPISSIITFRTPKELLEKLGYLQDVNYLYLWSDSYSKITFLKEQIKVKDLYINTYIR